MRLEKLVYLRFEVAMNHALGVHEMYNRHEFLHEFCGLGLGEPLLFAYPLKQLPALQVFHDDVRVSIILIKINFN